MLCVCCCWPVMFFALVVTSLLFCPSGDRAVQTSGCRNLSVEPVCRPRALHSLLVRLVHLPAVLRHHVWRRLSRPSGNHVLPAHKVWCANVAHYTYCPFVCLHWMLNSSCFCLQKHCFTCWPLQCLRMLCHTVFSSGSDLRGVLSRSRAAQPMQVLPGRLRSRSEWERHAQVRCCLQFYSSTSFF